MDLKKFRNPPAIHAPGYFWILNAPLNADELRRQIRDMAAVGAKTICPHPFPPELRDYFMSEMSPGYLSEEYFKLYRVIADECARLHLSGWLYDEGGWPSGMACGQVWQSDPEYFTRQLITLDESGNDWKIIKEEQIPGRAPRPDILKKGAVEKFLELTHENYYRHTGEHFGKTIRFAFMDEPEMARSSGALPWTDDFAEKFIRYKGYDIRPHLTGILKNDENSERYRIDYHDVRSRLFSERFLRPVRNWCRRHNLLSGGHMSGDDHLINSDTRVFGGHLLRSLRDFDFPGVDLIWRQIWMDGPVKSLNPFPKFASSVANQGGHRFVFAEVFGVYGSGLTLEQMIKMVDFCAVCGVNSYVACAKPYSTAGGLCEGERPHFGPVNPQWKHIKAAHDYTARISRLGSTGKPEVGTALYLDVRSLWAGGQKAQCTCDLLAKTVDRLLKSQVDFDYVDDDVLASAKLRKGKLVIGKACYERLIVPGEPMMEPDAAKQLERLKKRGLTVIYSGQPDRLIPPTLSSSASCLQVRKRRLKNGSVLYFVFNSSAEPVKASLCSTEKASVAVFDCHSGRMFRIGANGCWEYSFAPFRTAIFLIGSDADGGRLLPEHAGEVICSLENWQLRIGEKHYFGDTDYEIASGFRKRTPAKLGSWFPYLGKNFSGSAIYTTDFTGSSEMRFLDLGAVNYSARVWLNGKMLGTTIHAPHLYDLNGSLNEHGNNVLKIEVVNTLANAILDDSVWEKWQQLPHESPYEKKQRQFEAESVESGLFGPVTLRKAADR